MTPGQRRAAFIADIVEVCKRHRVKKTSVDVQFSQDWQTAGDGGSDQQRATVYMPACVWTIVQGEGK